MTIAVRPNEIDSTSLRLLVDALAAPAPWFMARPLGASMLFSGNCLQKIRICGIVNFIKWIRSRRSRRLDRSARVIETLLADRRVNPVQGGPVGRKWRRKPLYVCSRQFVDVRPRTVFVGRAIGYHPLMFAPVRRERPILLRHRCDERTDEDQENGLWVRADARGAAAHLPLN